jgi:methionyl-tRNA formyltransferase
MIVRTLDEALGTRRSVTTGNWRSVRLVLAEDGVGFSFHITTMFAGTETPMRYRNHVECVYCVEGDGELVDSVTGRRQPLRAGVLYLLDKHDPHVVHARTDLVIACVFAPALVGDEVHDEEGGFPAADSVRLEVPGCSTEADLRFAYLNLAGHPRGERMLERLVSAGFVPSLVIEEESALAVAGREAQLRELKQVPEFRPPPSTGHICAEHDVLYRVVPNHNDPAVPGLLAETGVHLGVLGDTRILRRHVIDAAPHGILNTHPGYLPDVRGNNPYIWAVIHGLPQGATVHLIDHRVDRGPVLLARELAERPGSVPRLVHAVNELCASVLVDALRGVVAGRARLTPQPDDGRMTFRAAPPGAWAVASEILSGQNNELEAGR